MLSECLFRHLEWFKSCFFLLIRFINFFRELAFLSAVRFGANKKFVYSLTGIFLT